MRLEFFGLLIFLLTVLSYHRFRKKSIILISFISLIGGFFAEFIGIAKGIWYYTGYGTNVPIWIVLMYTWPGVFIGWNLWMRSFPKKRQQELRGNLANIFLAAAALILVISLLASLHMGFFLLAATTYMYLKIREDWVFPLASVAFFLDYLMENFLLYPELIYPNGFPVSISWAFFIGTYFAITLFDYLEKRKKSS